MREDRGQFLQDGGALLGDEPGDLVRFDDLIAEVPEPFRDGGLAGAGLTGEADDDGFPHSDRSSFNLLE